MSIFDSKYYKNTLKYNNEEPVWVGDEPDSMSLYITIIDSEGKKKTFGRRVVSDKDSEQIGLDVLMIQTLATWCGIDSSVTRTIRKAFKEYDYFQNGRKWKE